MGFWPDAVLESESDVLLVWAEPEPAAVPAGELALASACGSSLPWAADELVARGAKGALAGIEVPSVNVPVLIPT